MVTFKVMTWNLENLYRPGTQFGPSTQADYEEKLASLADVILRLNPDVLALQEVGNPAALNDLVGLLQDHYQPPQLSKNPDPRGIRVGFLSKFTIQAQEDIVHFPTTGLTSIPKLTQDGKLDSSTRMGRGAFRIQVEPQPGFTVHMIAAHFKSKLLTFPNGRHSTNNEDERALVGGLALLQRTAEAVTIRIKANQLLQAHPHHGLVVLGDLNDGVSAATTQLLQGPSGSEIGTPGFKRSDEGDAVRLFNLAPLIPIDRQYSRVYKNQGELIDHIFANRKLVSPAALPTVDSHIDILGSLPSISDRPQARQGKPGSDHAPVTATFQLPP